jgi:hypothetical protein
MGIEPGQADPGYWIVLQLEKVGLASNVGAPREPSERDDLRELPANATQWRERQAG